MIMLKIISDFAKIVFHSPFFQQTFTEYLTLFTTLLGLYKRTVCPQQVYNLLGEREPLWNKIHFHRRWSMQIWQVGIKWKCLGDCEGREAISSWVCYRSGKQWYLSGPNEQNMVLRHLEQTEESKHKCTGEKA